MNSWKKLLVERLIEEDGAKGAVIWGLDGSVCACAGMSGSEAEFMEVDRVLEDPAEAKLRGVFLNGERFTVLSAPSGQCLKAICVCLYKRGVSYSDFVLGGRRTDSSKKQDNNYRRYAYC
uniref:Profilin n=1 Tax=Palpitomonas bilix TaxID=652834 RepID=A0A7S3DH88_9EUKA|mmetsp:Transcript_37519/g.96866  ORF Transcript_37519/g.96866 Transcript_37519/m.96866 type:complete len:120 (+) Transcript_37519:190-549(+)